VALLAAVALHVVLIVVLMAWLKPAQAATPPRQQLIMLEVVQPPPLPVPVPAPVPSPTPLPPQPQKPPKPPKKQNRPPRRPRPPAPLPNKAPTTPGPRLSLRMRGLDLTLKADPAGDTSVGDARTITMKVPPGRSAPRAEDEAGRVKARVDSWLARTQARNNAKSGQGHPYLYNVLRALDRNFEPTLAMIPKVKRRAPPAYLRAYKAATRRFMKMGSALPFEPGNMGVEVIPPKLLEGLAEIEQAVRDDGGQQLTAEICLRLNPGAVPEVETRSGCGVRKLDALAASALDTALRQLAGAAPADVPPGRACYTFTVRFGRDLPRLGLSCAFDTTLGKFDCSLPGREWMNKQVALDALYLR
jgi:hypothetical protein